MSAASLKWTHKRPVSYFPSCIEQFGQPTAISREKHGFALWKTKGLFSEHLLRDEDVKHCVPRPHHDYFYSSVKFYVPDDKFCDVLKVSGSIAYDGLKKLLTARCGGIGANYATLYLGMMIANGKLSLKQVQAGDMYPKMIRGELIPHDKLHSIMYKLKKENHKRYKKQLVDDFAHYAFKKCYSKTKKQKGGNSSKKTRKRVAEPTISKNTRNQKCSEKAPKSSHGWTSCCPHMPLDEHGHYRATNEMNVISYKGKEYELWTCCQMCADAMKKSAKETHITFKNDYIHSFEGTTMLAKNKHTGKIVQKMILHKK